MKMAQTEDVPKCNTWDQRDIERGVVFTKTSNRIVNVIGAHKLEYLCEIVSAHIPLSANGQSFLYLEVRRSSKRK